METGPPARSKTRVGNVLRFVEGRSSKEAVLKRWLLIIPVVFLATGILSETRLPDRSPGTVRMKVMKVRVDPLEGESMVILEDMDQRKVIPIWIGANEARAIYLEINGVVPPRPMTHDLIENILESLHVRLHHVLIHDVRQNIIYARLILKLEGREVSVDSRPSDAIALAVRVKAPILVTDEVYRNLSINLKPGSRKNSDLSV